MVNCDLDNKFVKILIGCEDETFLQTVRTKVYEGIVRTKVLLGDNRL